MLELQFSFLVRFTSSSISNLLTLIAVTAAASDQNKFLLSSVSVIVGSAVVACV